MTEVLPITLTSLTRIQFLNPLPKEWVSTTIHFLFYWYDSSNNFKLSKTKLITVFIVIICLFWALKTAIAGNEIGNELTGAMMTYIFMSVILAVIFFIIGFGFHKLLNPKKMRKSIPKLILLLSLIDKLYDLSNELVISMSKTKDDDVGGVLEDMENLIYSINDYDE